MARPNEEEGVPTPAQTITAKPRQIRLALRLTRFATISLPFLHRKALPFSHKKDERAPATLVFGLLAFDSEPLVSRLLHLVNEVNHVFEGLFVVKGE